MGVFSMRSRILRYWSYFRRGHSVYLAFIISFLNFIVIQYRLVISYIQFLYSMFSHLIYFALSFIAVYIPVAIVIGWWDYKRGAVITDLTLSARANPYFRDLAYAMYFIAQDRKDEAVKVLEKWIS